MKITPSPTSIFIFSVLGIVLCTFIMDSLFKTVKSGFPQSNFVGGPTVSYTQVPIIKTVVAEEAGLIYINNTTGKQETFVIPESEFDENAQPKKEGYTFFGSYKGKPIIATSSPELLNNQYYVIDYKAGKEIRATKINNKIIIGEYATST